MADHFTHERGQRYARTECEIAAAVTTVLAAAPERTLRESIGALVGAWFAIHFRDVRFHQRLETDFLPFDRSDDEDIRLTARIVADMTALLTVHRSEVAPADLTLAAHIVMRTLKGQVHAALERPLPGVNASAIEHAATTSILGYLLTP